MTKQWSGSVRPELFDGVVIDTAWFTGDSRRSRRSRRRVPKAIHRPPELQTAHLGHPR